MNRDNDRQTSIILAVLGILPIVWLGLLIAPSVKGGLPEIVPPDRGILFPVDDHEAMARAIRRILDGEVLFDRQKTSAQIKEKYSQDVIISRFEELYEQAVREYK